MDVAPLTLSHLSLKTTQCLMLTATVRVCAVVSHYFLLSALTLQITDSQLIHMDFLDNIEIILDKHLTTCQLIALHLCFFH